MSQAFVSLEKALDILCVFEPDVPERTAQDISLLMGFPLSSTYKYLEVLLRKGFLAKTLNRRNTGSVVPCCNLAATVSPVKDWLRSLSARCTVSPSAAARPQC